MNIINDCMRHASNREEFIALMESEGYKVRWEKSRKEYHLYHAEWLAVSGPFAVR